MNFILFFPDEMSASSVSCYGNKYVQMPNYDKLSHEGVRFENCIVQNPVCAPSRCCLMTGQYVHNHGHRTLWHLLRKNEPSLLRYLKEGGYDIAWFGKNDLFSQDYLEEICSDICAKRTGYSDVPSLPTGQVSKGMNPHPMEDPLYYSFLYDPIPSNGGSLIWDENVARGIDFLKSRKKEDKPFFLYLPTTMPHPPYNALEAYHKKYCGTDFDSVLISPDMQKDEPGFMALIREYRKLDALPKSVFEQIYSVYLGMNTYVDTMLGGILDVLDETGLAENTAIIVSSDHGDWAGNRGLVEKWPNAMDDDLVRVPLIIKTPACASGHVVHEIVEMFDIMPTVLELAGLEPNHTYFAKSLVPQINGSAGDPSRAAFCEGGYDTYEPHCSEAFEGTESSKRDKGILNRENIYYPKVLQQKEHPESVCRTCMLRTDEYKLIQRTSGDNELYDLKADPREICNAYNDENYFAVRTELQQRMLNWYIQTADIVPKGDDPRDFG